MGVIFERFMQFFGGFILIYMIAVIFTYSIMLILAFVHLRRQYLIDQREFVEDHLPAIHWKPVSIIIPVYNEEVGIIDSVHSLLNLRYPQTELIIVNDGSTDQTQQLAMQEFQMKPVPMNIREQIRTKPIQQVYRSDIYPNLWLIDKENGGKADALNVGINAARYPYFCSIDGDSILDENSLLRVMKPIMKSGNEVIAAGGNVRIANGFNIHLGAVFQANLSKSALVVMQVIEYFRAFLMGRIALSKLNMILIISGAFSVFSKKCVIEAGGYCTNSVGEDMELVVRLQRLIKEKNEKKRIEFVPDPVCWTEAPQTFSTLRKQRRRWQQGLMQSLWKHKKMTINPKYGVVGMISFPYFWFIEALGPIIELGGYIYVIVAYFSGDIYYEFAILIILLFILYGTVFSVASILLKAWSVNTYPKMKDVLRMMIISLTEVFWYKPLTLIWRCEGMIHFILRRKDWGKMQRVGLSKKGLSS